MKILVLCGSGEFTDAMNDTDQYLLSISRGNNVAIIPAAAGKENDHMKWIEWGVDHFSKLGAQAKGINIANKEDACSESYLKDLENTDFIYFSGGDPNYLFSILENTPLWKKVLEKYMNGIVLAGSSAGAMIMGKSILSNPFQIFSKQSEVENISGFNLVNSFVIPHFNRVPGFAKKNLLKLEYIGIDEDTVMIITDEKNVLVKGFGKVYINMNGQLLGYKEGDEFNLNFPPELISNSVIPYSS